MKITPKPQNTATKNTKLLLQALGQNKLRHQKLQEFMLANDSVTVAVEVPVMLTGKDLSHFQKQPGFQVPVDLKSQEVITGHIDILQNRNGAVHIFNYKPGAWKEKPIEQLTIYALVVISLDPPNLTSYLSQLYNRINIHNCFTLFFINS